MEKSDRYGFACALVRPGSVLEKKKTTNERGHIAVSILGSRLSKLLASRVTAVYIVQDMFEVSASIL